MDTINEKVYQEAEKRVKSLKKFYKHLATYLLVNGFLLALNLYQNPYYLWSLCIAACWGFGFLLNATSQFLPDFFLNENWEKRKIKELMEKEKNYR